MFRLRNCILSRRLYYNKRFPLSRTATIRYLLAALAVAVLLPAGLYADHIVGGEFHYACLGYRNNDPTSGVMRYRITINMYRDCIGEGALFDGGDPRASREEPTADGHISIYAGRQYLDATYEIRLSSYSDVPINLGNPCLVITEPICQEIGKYIFEIELPVSTETYTLVYQRCCRNESIRNIFNPRQNGATYFIQISPEAQLVCNTSPSFNIDPPIAICINEEFRIDLGATDVDGDSLVYTFCDPKLGGGTDNGGGSPASTPSYFDDIVPLEESPPPYTSVPWAVPTYNRDNQLGVGSSFNVDAVTGEISGVPIYLGTHVLGVCVEEWSRGPNPVLLSETKREFQLSVSRCENVVTADLLETEIDEQGRFFIRQCGPGEHTIINESTRISAITSYEWNLTGPGGELLSGTQRDFTTDIEEFGVYEGIMRLNKESFADNCKDSVEFLLGVYPALVAEFTTSDVTCEPKPVYFENTSYATQGQRITEYRWDYGDGSDVSLRRKPSHQYTKAGTFPVQLTVTDENGCVQETSETVDYFPAPRTIILEPQDKFGCIPYVNQFINRSRPIDSSYLFDWRFGDGGRGTDMNPVHRYQRAGIYDVYLSITSPLGCFVDTTFRQLVDVRESPIADFEYSPAQPTPAFPDVQILDRSQGSDAQRYFVSEPNGDVLFTAPGPDMAYRLRDTNLLRVTQVVTHPSGCLDTITKDLRMYLLNIFNAPNAFTPNGDGLNDEWIPKGDFGGVTGYQLRIWNRWGEKIYETDDYVQGWNGTHQGKDSPAGGYLWNVTFTNAMGDEERYKGGVVLIR